MKPGIIIPVVLSCSVLILAFSQSSDPYEELVGMPGVSAKVSYIDKSIIVDINFENPTTCSVAKKALGVRNIVIGHTILSPYCRQNTDRNVIITYSEEIST